MSSSMMTDGIDWMDGCVDGLVFGGPRLLVSDDLVAVLG